MVPRLVHALGAKLMVGHYNKNDKLDARGMNLLYLTHDFGDVSKRSRAHDWRSLRRLF